MAQKFRKGLVQSKKPRSQLSADLLLCSQLIDQRQVTEALERLNSIAAAQSTPLAASNIKALVGDSQFKLGRYDEAISYYQAALNGGLQDDVRGWFRPSLAIVFSLLKSGDQAGAKSLADQLTQRAIQLSEEFERHVSTSANQVTSGAILKIPSRPIRPSVVITKLGAAFLQAGEIAIAEEFFKLAVTRSPSGATRARQGLARLALATDTLDLAERYARESLSIGRFQAKTICAWNILVTARARQGKEPLDSDLYNAFSLMKQGPVKDRAILAIIVALRSVGDKNWKQIYESNLITDKIVRVEIMKILANDAKIEKVDNLKQISEQLLNSEDTSPLELIAAAKLNILAALKKDEPLAIASILARCESRFGKDHAAAALHGCALAAISAGKNLEARQLLQQALTTHVSDVQRAKDLWALGKVEMHLGLFQYAASRFLSLAENNNIDAIFRVQALGMWIRSCQQGELSYDEEDVNRRLIGLLSALKSYDVILDFARQVKLLGPTHTSLFRRVAALGEAAALNIINSSIYADEKLSALIHLSRRQFFDFDKASSVISVWGSLSKQTLADIRSESSLYGEYLSIVFKAFISTGQNNVATAFANKILNDPSSPLLANFYIGIAYADFLIEKRRLPEAMSYYEWLATIQPANRNSAIAHYWLALKSWVGSDVSRVQTGVRRIHQCFSDQPGFEWEKRLFIRTLMLESKMDDSKAEQLEVEASKYEGQWVEDQRDRLARDIELVRKA